MKWLVVPVALFALLLVVGCENPKVEYNPYNPQATKPEDTRPIGDKVDDFQQRVQDDLRNMQ